MTTHRFDPLSFLAGLVFTTLGITAMAGGLDELETLRVGWPLLLIGFGVLLVGSTFGGRDRDESAPALTPHDAAPPHDDLLVEDAGPHDDTAD